jgi:hypothetical protein
MGKTVSKSAKGAPAKKAPAARAHASVPPDAASVADGLKANGKVSTAGTTASPSVPPPGASSHEEGRSSATTEAADKIIVAADAAAVLAHAENLASDKPTTATTSARILDDLLVKKPDLLVSAIERFVVSVASPNKRTVQTSAAALPVMAKLAPARVARHLPQLTEAFSRTNEVGKDGLVSTFAALCTASVAYQKRLEPVLELALSTAEPKTLLRWTEIVLPSLKGEPHARARAVVEARLGAMPRAMAQPIAGVLGIKLRPLGR